MDNIYDRYRRIHKRKHTCEFERSAAFIRGGGISVEIIHHRLDEERMAGLVFKDKEGPDDVTVFTELFSEKNEELLKGDYFIWDDTFYLVFEDVKLVNENLNYKKQRAVECNVSFDLKGTRISGAFYSTMRRFMSGQELKQTVALSVEETVVVVPLLDAKLIGERISIGGKPWRVKDYDSITNRGITYLYLQKDVFYEDVEGVPTYETQAEGALSTHGEEEVDFLYALKEYEFETSGGYFAAVPAVEVVSKTRNKVVFMIPFFGEPINISLRNNEGEIIEQHFSVVRQ